MDERGFSQLSRKKERERLQQLNMFTDMSHTSMEDKDKMKFNNIDVILS